MTNSMPIKAKVMIGMVAVASLCRSFVRRSKWQSQSWPQLTLLLRQPRLSSRLKVKIPGLTSSMSGNLPVVLSGSDATRIVRKPCSSQLRRQFPSPTVPAGINVNPFRFVFNTCTLLNAAALAYLAYHSQLFGSHTSANDDVSGYWPRSPTSWRIPHRSQASLD